MRDEQSRTAITGRGLPSWTCRTGLQQPRPTLRWVAAEQTQVGWLMALPLPRRMPADVAVGAVPAALRGFADAGGDAEVASDTVGGRRLYTIDVATGGVDADVAAWTTDSAVVVLFLLQPRDAAETARRLLGGDGPPASPTGP